MFLKHENTGKKGYKNSQSLGSPNIQLFNIQIIVCFFFFSFHSLSECFGMGEPHSLKVALSRLSSLHLLKRLKDASASQQFVDLKGTGKAGAPDDSGTKLVFSKLGCKQVWRGYTQVFFKSFSLRKNRLKIWSEARVRGGDKLVASPLMGCLESRRHSIHVYTNERISVTLYGIL